MGAASRFAIPDSDGIMVDELTIECYSMNGVPFTGSLGFTEMRTTIPKDGLGIDPENIHSVRHTLETCPVIRLMLKTKIEIENLRHKEFFVITRLTGVDQNYDVVSCKLRGLKKKIATTQVETQEEFDQGIRWVSVEGADYKLHSNEIINWLGKYTNSMHTNFILDII